MNAPTIIRRAHEFHIPKNTQRVTIVGRTGSGKTIFGGWLLSEAPFDRQPYIIVDYKYDELFEGLDRVTEIGLKDKPKKPGLYIVHPIPDSDDEAVEQFLWGIWRREKTGIFFDEYYNIPDTAPLRAILTQGRSKRIPVIGLTQRPAWISRFAFSEADYFAIFHLSDQDDRLKVRRMAATDPNLRLPEHWCQWFDVKQDAHFYMRPAPSPDDIRNVLHERLAPRRRFT